MQCAVENGNGLIRFLTITISNDEIQKNIDKELQQVSKHARIDGFRPGKVPLSFIRKRYGDSIREQEVIKLMEHNIDLAVRQEKLDVASIVNVEKLKDEPGQNLEYKTEVEVYPEIAFKDLSSTDISEFSVDIVDADVEDMLTRLRQQRCEWKEVTRAVKNEDQAIIDFEGTLNGQPFRGNSGKEFALVLGSKTMLPGFEEGILKHKAGDKFTLDLPFPADYPSTEVAGKTAQFAIILHKVNEQVLPELNDEFAKTLEYPDGVDSLRKAMREDMEKTVERALREKVKQEVTETLLAVNQIPIPSGLLEQAKEGQLQRLQKQHGKDDFPDAYKKKLFEETEKKLRFDLLLRDYIKANKIALDDNRFSQKLAEVVANSPFASEMLQYIAKDPQRRAEIEHMALEEQVIDILLAGAKRKAKKISYKEALDIDQTK